MEQHALKIVNNIKISFNYRQKEYAECSLAWLTCFA
jgi:hypothetical protein